MTERESAQEVALGLEFREMMTNPRALDGKKVFLSASIPDPRRWTGSFEPLAITDAVVACTRAVLTAGGILVTAAHPTIAPLLLYVARELPEPRGGKPSVIVYQSRLFDDALPPATYDLAERGVGRLVWTEAAPDEEPIPGRSDQSLAILRQRMMEESEPVAAVFIGGMEGIAAEFDLFRRLFPGRPVYPVARPGGAAAALTNAAPADLEAELTSVDSYPGLFRRIVDDIGSSAEKAAAELARIHGQAPGFRELSQTERRIAELVAKGLSNKEIARNLFVTVRTVDAHLSKVYAKLGIRSRTELARRLRP